MKIKMKKRYIGAVISLVLLFLVFQKMDFTEIVKNLKLFNLKNLILAIPLYFAGYILRAKRWKALMLNLPHVRSKTLLGITFVGYAVNCFMPARAGDFYRAHLAGNSFGLSRVSIVSSILLERILDGIVVFGFLLFVMMFFYNQPWLYNVAFSAGALFFGVFGLIYWMIKFGNMEKFFRKITVVFKKYGMPIRIVAGMRKGTKHIASFIDGFEVLNQPKILAKSFLFTTSIWLVECLFLFVIINGFGVKLGLPVAMFLLCLTVFSSMVPSLSIHTGPYQCAFILALNAFSINKEMAIAMAFVTQIIIISFLAITGAFYMFKYHIKVEDIKHEIEEEQRFEEEQV